MSCWKTGTAIAALALVSCDRAQTPMNEAERLQAQEEKRLEADPCMRRQGDAWAHVGFRNCLKFKPAERMHGVWYYGFEESGFLPNATSVSLDRDVAHDPMPEFNTLLDLDRDTAVRDFKIPAMGGCTQAIAVEFVGRKSIGPEPETIGFKNGVIVVDKVLSAHLLGNVRSKMPNGNIRRC